MIDVSKINRGNKLKGNKLKEPLSNRWIKNENYKRYLKNLKEQKHIDRKNPKVEGKYDLRFLYLKKSSLTNVSIISAILDDCNCYYAIYNSCKIENCRIIGGDFEHSKFSDTEIINCIFEDCTFVEGMFYNTKIHECTFINCEFNYAKFDNISINGTEMNRCCLSDLKNDIKIDFIGKPKSMDNISIDRISFIKLKNNGMKEMIQKGGIKLIDTFNGKYMYDVAISYASEQKKDVEKMVHILDTNGIKLFYDNFETSNLWGEDLEARLIKLYSHESEYVIVFLSTDYLQKKWTTIEQKAILKRNEEEKNKVLIINYGDLVIDGFSDQKAYLDIRKYEIENIARIFIDKFIDNYKL